MSPSIESVEWKPRRGSKILTSESALLLQTVKPGEVMRIVHDDIHCKGNSGSCSLCRMITRLRTQGWVIQHYHEEPHVIVVKRIQ